MSQKIYFEGLGLVESHFSGIGQYILGILRGIDSVIEKDKLDGKEVPTVKVIIPYDTINKFNSYEFKHISALRFPMKFRYMAALWHRGKMPPIDLFCGKAHYVFTRFVGMPLLFSDYSVIVYDISFELYKQFSDENNANFLSKGTRNTVEGAKHVFTISQNAKKEIIDFYNVPEDKIIVSTPAADQRYFYKRSDDEISKIKVKYGINKDYILALSNLEPRKNIDTTVEAYCNMPAKYRDEVSLLLVGVSGWKTDAMFTKIKQLAAEGFDIIRPNAYVHDNDKPAIISGAKMLVYPSHYEGFGMPPLEALACGVPVITADNSSLPEVVGGVGTMLNCTNTKGFSSEMIKHLDWTDAQKNSLLRAGPAKAEEFSWGKSAQIYLDILSGDTK